MDKLYVADTNILLDAIENLKGYKIVLLSSTLRELEKHKSSHDENLKYNARRVSRFIRDHIEDFYFDTKDYDGSKLGRDYDNTYQDNNILMACVDNQYGLITNDVLLGYKAKGFNLEVINLNNEVKEEYKGYTEIFATEKELESLVNIFDDNPFNLHINEYLIVKDIETKDKPFDEHQVLDVFKFDGNFYNRISAKGFTTNAFGKFSPMDVYQKCALDSLEENNFTMIKGKAGSGKSLLALNYAFKKIEKGKRDKLIIFANPVASKNSAKLGFYPGTRDEKLIDSSVGSTLASKFGDKTELERLIQDNIVMLLPFSDIRGFDTTGMNAICYILEAQNLDIELAKLAIQRVSEDCELIIDGDYNSQVDSYAYEGANNGMRRVSEIFRGEDYYGEIELPIIYRSRMAKRADLMTF